MGLKTKKMWAIWEDIDLQLSVFSVKIEYVGIWVECLLRIYCTAVEWRLLLIATDVPGAVCMGCPVQNSPHKNTEHLLCVTCICPAKFCLYSLLPLQWEHDFGALVVTLAPSAQSVGREKLMVEVQRLFPCLLLKGGTCFWIPGWHTGSPHWLELELWAMSCTHCRALCIQNQLSIQ